MTTQTVTSDQLAACTRHIDPDTREVFYTAQSATDVNKTYTVRWNKRYKVFSCDCPAGQGTTNCWHRRAVFEAATQYANAKRAEREAQVRELLATRKRVMNAQPTCYSEQEIARDLYQPAPFSLLR